MNLLGTLERLWRELPKILGPLAERFADEQIEALFLELGLRMPRGLLDAGELDDPLTRARAALATIIEQADELDEAVRTTDRARIKAAAGAIATAGTQLVDAVRDVGIAVKTISAHLPGLTPAQRAELESFTRSLPDRLLGRLVVDYLDEHAPQLVSALLLAGGIEIVDEPAGPIGSLIVPHVRKAFFFDRIVRLLNDPAGVLRQVYGWGGPGFDGAALFRNVSTLIARTRSVPAAIIETPGLPLSLEAFGFSLAVNDALTPPGLDVSLRFPVDLDINETLTDAGWEVKMHQRVLFAADLDAMVRPLLDVELVTPDSPGEISVSVEVTKAAGGDPIVLGDLDGSRLEIQDLKATIALEARWESGTGHVKLEPTLRVEISGAKLIVQELGIDQDFDIGLTWSPGLGLAFDGGQLGPVTVERVKLEAESSAGKSRLGVVADAAITLDPLSIRLEGLGLRLVSDDADTSGPFGLGGLDVEWVRPRIRLVLDGEAPVLPVDVTALHLSRECLAVRFREPNLARWLGALSPTLGTATATSEVTLRAILDGTSVREVRLDWEVTGASHTLNLPFLQVTTPQAATLRLILGGQERDSQWRPLSRVALGLTFQPNTALVLASTFAWDREEDRESHNDDERSDPLIELTVTAKQVVTLMVIDFALDEAKLPRFLQQTSAPLVGLDFNDPDLLKTPSALDLGSLTSAAFDVALRLNLDSAAFTLPFLQQEPGASSQFIQIDRFDPNDVEIQFTPPSVKLPIGITVAIGEMRFNSKLDFIFDWERFAFSVNHEGGLKFLSGPEEELLGPFDHLGLRWTFKGAPHESGRFHHFTLVTKDYNYQIQQAEGASILLAYDKASADPIEFSVTDFVLSAKGVSLSAAVTDVPVRLNGIDQKFRFTEGRLEIKENRINDFTIAGSGDLPPDLVGQATVDIALQFSQREGGLALVMGSARLRGTDKLKCQGTRFQFAIDALELKFVNDGKFHLYFTLTGRAQLVLGAGDDNNLEALALLPKIQIDLVDCPLVGDARVLAKHVKFLVELPKPRSFNFLGCFEMELRGIGFQPQADVFNGDPAMLLTGQLKFAQGAGDASDPRTDYHKLFIGLPPKGSFVPRIHFENLPVNLNFGEAFRLNGAVNFVDGLQEKGFMGEGMLQIQGLPQFAASFAFLRVRRDAESPWIRAWFIYLEVRQISFMIPVVQVYIREVGLGFGYRFTLVSLKTADRANDLRQLITELTKLSRTQGDLSKRDRWAVDLEEAGEEPRWTVALRAMISQTSAAPSPLRWDAALEKDLSCVYLMDATIALRSDLTFLMTVRGWLNANYYDFVTDAGRIREAPLVSGFVLLSPRRKRLLAHLASNPDGKVGKHPPLPPFVERALSKSQFSATLLIEPGLMHYELGWPNMLRWADQLGPLDAELRGGFIFRISNDELVIGNSFLARARLAVSAEANLGIVGARVSATADVAYGARYIGLFDFRQPALGSALYGGIGLEAHIQFFIEFWIRIKLGFIKITKTFRFSLALDFTAALEVGFANLSFGLRGQGTVAVSFMGRRLQLNMKFGLNEGMVEIALARTQHVLNLGLEATEVEPLPGLPPPAPRTLRAASRAATAEMVTAATEPTFEQPGYVTFAIASAHKVQDEDVTYFALIPQGQRPDGSTEIGFLPPPPTDGGTGFDFSLQLSAADGTLTIQWFNPDPAIKDWDPVPSDWRADWHALVEEPEHFNVDDDQGDISPSSNASPMTLQEYLVHAFVTDAFVTDGEENPKAVGDPELLPELETLRDERVQSPTDNAFEAAVRGAYEQFRGAPYFKRDMRSPYEARLQAAFDDLTSIYTDQGRLPGKDDPERAAAEAAAQAQQQAHELRGVIVHDMVADLRAYAAATEQPAADTVKSSVLFQMGLAFRALAMRPKWLDAPSETQPQIRQRTKADGGLGPQREVRPFNTAQTSFAKSPPEFSQVQVLTDARTIAIAWELGWSTEPEAGLSPAQRDPEHHLLHYEVRRRELGGNEPEAVYTVKTADVLHREEREVGAQVVVRLRARFQVVDHFNNDTLADLAALPATGRRYLYSITPVDFAGNKGRPLTVVATRHPSEPPLVPVNAECTVAYDIRPTLFDPKRVGSPTAPHLLLPQALRLEWSDPTVTDPTLLVPVAKHYLVMRRQSTLPIGSYGLDAATEQAGSGGMPATNARRLPTDIAIPLTPSGTAGRRQATVSLDELRANRVFPLGENPLWEPRSFHLFLQTESWNGVPSVLAPVSLRLRVFPTGTADPDTGPREERRPAELEWLPKPMRFPLLPPEDQAAETGDVHVPMPLPDVTDGLFKFRPDIGNVRFGRHPGRNRVVRFRFNQAPSKDRTYALELAAGFEILELDVDSHTTVAFTEKKDLAAALRALQEVQMVPQGDLLLVPGDTQTPGQWEAFYPSAVQRRYHKDESPPEGAETPTKAWLGPRDSYLDWPAWPGLTDGAFARTTALHPVLGAIVELLSRPPETLNGGKRLSVDLQIAPPAQPQDLAAFLQVTPPASDPYGWGVLQRLGLAVTFSLRDPQTGAVMAGAELLTQVNNVFTYLDGTEDGVSGWEKAGFKDATDYLFVDLLFQPGQRIRLTAGEPAGPEQLLGLLQLSLRPRPVPRLRYWQVQVTNVAKKTLKITIDLAAGRTAWLIIQSEPTPREETLEARGPDPVTFERTTVAALDGTATLLLRAEEPVSAIHIETSDGETPTFTNTPLEFRDFRTTYFTVPLDFQAAAAWERFRHYLEALSSTDPSVPDTQEIRVPTGGSELKAVLPDLLGWTQRFFDASGAYDHRDLTKMPEPLTGPQIATAYPRAGSPAYAAPDESGRLTYDHMIEDPWGHTYRYYIRPYGRYDRLWRGLQQSAALFPTGRFPVTDETPEPDAGALDVVLDRMRPVVAPLVLGSRRLDGLPVPGAPVTPGRTWEVMVAEHTEQALVERNQTLVRQLGFRGIAFTLLRRFVYGDWRTLLEKAAGGGPILLKIPGDVTATVPTALPAKPDHLDLTALGEEDRRSLDLPQRLGSFRQGALVLQWEALPFFYEHRLLLVAQTTRVVSPLNQVTQRDFEYVTPQPEGRIEGAVLDWWPEPPFGPARTPPTVSMHAQRVELPLRRLWEALSPDAQERWPFEAPDGRALKLGWLPDLEVVYQIVALFSGNIEVQAEISFDKREDEPRYVRRQFGKQLLVDIGALAPTSNPSERFRLSLTVQPVTDEPTSRSYEDADKGAIAEPTRHKVAFEDGRMRFVGPLTATDRANLKAVLHADDHALIDRLFATWYAQEPVSAEPASVPPTLATVVDFPDPSACWLVWQGPISSAERQALMALPGDPEFKAALTTLADKAAQATGGQVSVVAAPRGADQVPTVLKDHVSFGLDASGAAYTTFTWSGLLDDDRWAILDGWAQIAAFRAAVQAVRAAADAPDIERLLPPARPLPSELPPELAGQLGIEEALLTWEGPAPSDAERAALAKLTGDADFLDALSRLLGAIDARREVPLPPETVPNGQPPRRPRPEDLPTVLQGLLVIGTSTLAWNPPMPSDAERTALRALTGDLAFETARDTLLAAIDADQAVTMAAVPRRPRPEDAPSQLAGQLTIEPTRLRWTGKLHSQAQRQALVDLHGDPPFDAAITSLVAELDAPTFTVLFDSPVRPAQAQLGPLLSGKLLIGRVLLRHHGLLARTEAALLAGAFGLDLDMHAVTRLYRQSQANAHRGRTLKLRARRGAAAPTPFVDLTWLDPL